MSVEVLALEDVEVRHRDGRRDRVPSERVPVVERRGPAGEGLEQPVGRDHRPDRGVAGGHPLGARDHVRHVPVVVAGEHVADAAERADDLVGDEQHVVGVADLPDAFEVAGRRREAPARVLHRLEEDRGHRVGTLELDGLLDAVRCPQPERLVVVPQVLRRPVRVRVRHLERTGHQRLEHLLGGRDPGDGQRPLRRPVVGHRPADDLVLVGLAHQLPVLLGELPRSLDGLAAPGGEEDPVEVRRCVVGQPLGEVDGGGVRVGPEREEREVLRLARRRLRQHGPPVTDLDDEEPGEPVEVLLARVVPDVCALALDHDGHLRTVVVRGVTREVHPQVVAGRIGAAGPARGAGAPVAGGLGVDGGSGHRVPQL